MLITPKYFLNNCKISYETHCDKVRGKYKGQLDPVQIKFTIQKERHTYEYMLQRHEPQSQEKH